jgi:hypothetical protein
MARPYRFEMGQMRHDRGQFIDKGNYVFDVSNPDYAGRGAKGDGVTDDTQAILEAVTDANAMGGGIVYFQPGTYIVSSLAVPANITLDLGWSTLTCSGQVSAASNFKVRNGTLDFSGAGAISGGAVISSGGSVGSDIALSANADRYDDTLTFASAAAISGISAGDWIVVKSTQNWNVAGTIKQAEIVRVLSKADNVLTLYEQLDYAHTTANSACIARITYVEGWHFQNVKVLGDDSVTGVNGINTQYLKDAVFENVGGTGFRGRMLQLRTCYNVEVRNPIPREGDPSVDGGLNYGVSIVEGCHHVRVNSAHAQNVRHVVTIGGTTWPNRFIQVKNISGAGLTDAAVDAHPACDHLLVDGVQTSYKGTAACEAVISQGARCQISNVESTGDGGFAVVRWQPFIAANIPLSAQITNVVGSGTLDRIVAIDQQGTTTITGLQIDNAMHAGGGSCEVLVDLNIEEGDLRNFSITNWNGEEITDRAVYVHAEGTTDVSHGQISGGTAKMATGSNSCIRLQAGASATLTKVYVGGNVLDGGTYGLNAPDATIDYITVGPNVYLNQDTAATNIVGANSQEVAYV